MTRVVLATVHRNPVDNRDATILLRSLCEQGAKWVATAILQSATRSCTLGAGQGLCQNGATVRSNPMAPRDPPKPEKTLADSASEKVDSHLEFSTSPVLGELTVIPVILGHIDKLEAPTLVGTNEPCPGEECEKWTMKPVR